LAVRVAVLRRSDLGDDGVWSLLARAFRKLGQSMRPKRSTRRVAPSRSTAARCRPSRGAVSVRAGLPPVTFHALRHTAATLLLSEGEHPKVIQELLGHAQISITLDRYSHMTPRLISNAAVVMDRLLDEEA
jgi:integrase